MGWEPADIRHTVNVKCNPNPLALMTHMVISGLKGQISNSDDFCCPFTSRGYFVIFSR